MSQYDHLRITTQYSDPRVFVCAKGHRQIGEGCCRSWVGDKEDANSGPVCNRCFVEWIGATFPNKLEGGGAPTVSDDPPCAFCGKPRDAGEWSLWGPDHREGPAHVACVAARKGGG